MSDALGVLEPHARLTPDDIVLARESHLKRVLFTRGDEGLNRN